MAGTYRFKTVFYGLTDMPAEFQTAMDYKLIGLEKTFCFLILILRKSLEEDHSKHVTNCL